MKSLEPRTEALLRATRESDDPTDDQVLRVRHSLMAKIAVGGAVAAGIETVSSSATGAAGSGLALKLSLLPMAVKVSLSAAVLGLGALGGWKLATSASAHRPPVVAAEVDPRSNEAPPVLAPETVPPTTLPQPEPESLAAPPARVAPRPSSHQPTTSARELEEEARLLAEVQTALGAGHGPQALDKLKEYDQRFAGGVLRAEAQSAARRFLRRYPSSPSASRVEHACADQ